MTTTLTTTPGDPNADSYAATADADTYFANRGITAWTGDATTVKEPALRRATSYLDNRYRNRWIGMRYSLDQALAWPRGDGKRGLYVEVQFIYPLIDIDGLPIPTTVVPLQVQQATMEAALLILSGVSLEPTLARGNAIKSLSTSVGTLRKETVYMDGAPGLDQYTVIEGLLRGLATGFGNISLVRS